MSTSVKSNRLTELDALRGVAAMLVIIFHLTMESPVSYLRFKYGVTGVDLFFLISGFVIFMSIEKVSRGIDFVINRLSRLYPTYWASVTLTFLLTILFASGAGIGKYLANMTMFQFYFNVDNLDGQYWTLIIEMIFYAFILFLFQFKLLKHLSVIGITLMGAELFAATQYGDTAVVKNVLYWFPLLQYFPLFFAGTVFYRIYFQQGRALENYLMIYFCFVTQLSLFYQAGRSHFYMNRNEYIVMLLIYFGLFLLFANRKLGFIVSKKALFLGQISFALYLTPQHLSTTMLIPFLTKVGINFWISAFVITLPALIAVAALITYKIEIPYHQKMKVKLRSFTS